MSVPKEVSFQVNRDRLKFYDVEDIPITKAFAFWANGRQIRILSKTTVPDDPLRIDLMFETADDVEACAQVLHQDELPCYDLSGSSYTYHFEISRGGIQQILVLTEPLCLKINPGQQIIEIAKKARVVCSGPKAAEALDEKVNGMKRSKLRELGQSLSRACLDKVRISDDMAINWGTSIEALSKLRQDEWGTENETEYLTPEEEAIVRKHFPTDTVPSEAPDPHETQLIEVDSNGNLKESSATLITDPAERATFYNALSLEESYE